MTPSIRRTAYLGSLCFALCMTVPSCLAGQDMEAVRLAMTGGKLSPEAAGALELQVKAAPDDVEGRIKLLGYYFLRAHTSPEARSAKQEHVLWLIRNRPDAPILETPYARLDNVLERSAYEEGKKAWMEQVGRQPQNAALLGRAAGYFLLSDSAMAESLYRRAEAAEPQNPAWPGQLGHLYALGLMDKTGEGKQQTAKAALEAYERSLERMKGGELRESVLSDVATVALEAGEMAKARSYAERLVAEGGRDGDMVHHGHVVLGRIALRAGDVDAAKQHLLAAGETPGSAALRSFGPNMRLARELLEKGERQAVLDYVKLCGSFWNRDKLAAWSKEVEAGKTPDFGPNLVY
jgi:tetratricopeptide (TPR) repeat protein